MNTDLNLETLNRLARQHRKTHKVSLSKAQEAIAKQNGYKDFHHATTALSAASSFPLKGNGVLTSLANIGWEVLTQALNEVKNHHPGAAGYDNAGEYYDFDCIVSSASEDDSDILSEKDWYGYQFTVVNNMEVNGEPGYSYYWQAMQNLEKVSGWDEFTPEGELAEMISEDAQALEKKVKHAVKQLELLSVA